MYFSREELVPFLQDVDATVRTVCNDNGFRKYGTSLVLETTKFVYSETKLKDKFYTVLTSCLGSTDCFKTSAVNDVFRDLVSKLTNTKIQEFLDSHKATPSIIKRHRFCFWTKFVRHFAYSTCKF